MRLFVLLMVLIRDEYSVIFCVAGFLRKFSVISSFGIKVLYYARTHQYNGFYLLHMAYISEVCIGT